MDAIIALSMRSLWAGLPVDVMAGPWSSGANVKAVQPMLVALRRP